MCFISVKKEEDDHRVPARAVRRREISPRRPARQIIIEERRPSPRASVTYVAAAPSVHSFHPAPPPEPAPSAHTTSHSHAPSVAAESVRGGTVRSVREQSHSHTIEVEEDSSGSESGSSASGSRAKTAKSRHSHAPSRHSASRSRAHSDAKSRSRAPSNAGRSEYDIIDREYEHRRETIHPPHASDPYDTYRYVQAPPNANRERRSDAPRFSYGEDPRASGTSYRRERERIVIQDEHGRSHREYRR